MTGVDHSELRGGIDVHAHLLTAEALAARPRWAQPAGGPVEVDEQLRRMDAAGIERALLIAPKIGRRGLPGSWELDPAVVSAVVAAHPDRFGGLYGINPYDGVNGAVELERLVAEHGFVGAQLYPHWFARPADDPYFYPFYAKCRQLGIPVQIHVGTISLRTPEQRLVSVARPNQLDRIACDMPDLKIVATHGAWPWAEELVAVVDKHGNVSAALNRRPPGGWGDAVRRYAGSWGRGKVLFGGDAAHVGYGDIGSRIADLTSRPDSRQALFRTNAVTLYGLAGVVD